jgi:hypothetical protein
MGDFAVTEIQRAQAAMGLPVVPEPPVAIPDQVAAVEAANQMELMGQGSELSFRFDRKTRRPVIEVLDKTTGEVIRQIPPEYLVRVMQNLLKNDR